jgi:hypothetical protein
MNNFNIDAHPFISSMIGLVLGVIKNTADLINGAAHLDAEKMQDTFILGFIGAAGGLLLSLIVKSIKYLWEKRKKNKLDKSKQNV